MAEPGTNENKRSAQRTVLIKLAFLKKDDQAIGCLLKDISLTGAQFDFIKLPGLDPLALAIGDHVQLVVDEVGEAAGAVARVRIEVRPFSTPLDRWFRERFRETGVHDGYPVAWTQDT